MATHILFETATGFYLFQVTGTESIAEFTPQVQKDMEDYSKFSRVVKMIGSVPFTTAENALENINALSEGLLTDLLTTFLKSSFTKKNEKVILGVSENKLAASIQQTLSISCLSNDQTSEIIRCIRQHIPTFAKISGEDLNKAQLGLGHSYSRSKVKFNVHKVDNMIIQSIALIDQINKDLNLFYMRVREWYSLHFPELFKIVKENIHFVKLTKLIQNKSSITPELIPEIKEIVQDDALAQDVYNASKSSMGSDILTLDLQNIIHFADRVISLQAYQSKLNQYLNKKMQDIAPNLSTLVGNNVGAKLISRAGSLTNLAKMPASTVQIIGAEKALFRAMKVRGKTPKYGILYNASFLGGDLDPKYKGRVARCLANKVSIASRIDCFSEKSTTKFGSVLKKQVEDRIKFMTSGVAPKRNLEVMREVIDEVEKDFAAEAEAAEEVPTTKKESKKRSLDESESKKSSKKQKKDEKKEKKEDEMKVDKKSKKEDKKDKKDKKDDKKDEKESSSKKEKKSSKKSSADDDEMKVDKKEKKKSKK
eukprot:gene6600-8169_t